MWPFFWITTPTPTLGAGLVSSIGTMGQLITFCPESLLVYVAGAVINKNRDGKTFFACSWRLGNMHKTYWNICEWYCELAKFLAQVD